MNPMGEILETQNQPTEYAGQRVEQSLRVEQTMQDHGGHENKIQVHTTIESKCMT